VATHGWSDAIAIVANMHVVASLPSGLMVEVDRTGNSLVDQLLTEPLRVENGEIALPQKPGLGIELDPEAIERFAVPGGDFPAGNYSDLVFGQRFYTPAADYEAELENA
jgi:L-alanine-DL-glutamate epimerase-like enolase superfamily enzyme